MTEMAIPEFLNNYDEDDIHEEMMELIPDEYDKSEGQHLYNMTRPAAYIISQLRGFDLPEAIKLIWPKTSNGEYLEMHAEPKNIVRKAAQPAKGIITFTGAAGTIIPVGYTVSTESKNDIPSQDYTTDAECVIGENGTVDVAATAVVAGVEGNTAANTIVVNTSSYDDIVSVTNNAPFIGGIVEEDDDSLYARLHEYNITQADSNVGNPSDYKRWAESVEGTGTAKVNRAKDGTGLVTIILTDGNGNPASEELCQKVYDYIMSPEDENARIAPCGARLQITSPETKVITITGTVELTAGDIESITKSFVEALKEYSATAIANGEILYHKVCNILGDIEGVYDFYGITLNGGTANVSLEDGSFPSFDASNITLTLAE